MINFTPKIIFFETTSSCNLNCVHCRRSDISNNSNKDLSTDEIYHIIDSISDYAKPMFILSGGEPLVRDDIFDIVNYAQNKGLQIALATNGTLIDEEMALKIKESGIRRVSVSLDGASAQTHDSIRKIDGAFDRSLKGIENLKANGISFQLNFTIIKDNQSEIEDVYKLAIELKADALHYFLLVPVGCGAEIADSQMLSPQECEEAMNKIYELSKKEEIFIKPTCAPHYYRIAAQNENLPIQTKGCLAGQSVCFVSHKGEVFPCGYLPLSSGNLLEKSFKEIWENSEIFNQLRNPDLLIGKCGVCEFKQICGGCRARAYFKSGNFLSEEPYCFYNS